MTLENLAEQSLERDHVDHVAIHSLLPRIIGDVETAWTDS